jgi:hypothetical protein
MARRSSLLKANPFIARQLQHPAPSEHTDDPLLKSALKGTDGAAWSPAVVRTLSGLIGNRATAQAVQRTIAISTGAPAAIQRDLADDIANGHAWDKHVIDEDLFPDIETRAEFAQLLRDVMASPDGTKDLARGRKCYIKGNIVLITDPRSRDKGTCFTNHNPSAKMARLT